MRVNINVDAHFGSKMCEVWEAVGPVKTNVDVHFGSKMCEVLGAAGPRCAST